MAAIEQLALTGIRSFDPDPQERQLLVFSKPVTVILGPNGAGKTTIIEALRNACTGEFPGGGKGAAFVHDPKVAGETEVKGQVRMQFRGCSGQQYLITKSFQLSQQTGVKQKFETLDATLQSRDPKTGQVVSQSHKCCDIDRLIPEIIGISKPILDNVIFLHQDDVNWPLQEPAVLKKKFDDIFSSARYTKALDEIRKVTKENKDNIKEHTANLAVYKEQRIHAHQLRTQCDSDQHKIQQFRDREMELKRQVDAVQVRIDEQAKHSGEIQALEATVLRMRGVIDALTEERDLAERDLKEVSTESDEKLREAFERYSTIIDSFRQTEEQLLAKLKRLKADQLEEERRLGELRSEREVLTMQGDEHQRRVAQLRGVVNSVSERYDLRLPGHVSDAEFDEASILRFHDAFAARVGELRKERDGVRDEVRRANDGVQREVDTARREVDQLNASMSAARQRNDAGRPRIRDLKEQYQRLESADAELAAASARAAELERRQAAEQAESAARAAAAGDLGARQEGLQRRVRELQAEVARRRDEQAAAHKVKLYREEQERCRRESADTRQRIEARYAQLVGRKLSIASLHDDVAAAVQSKQQAVDRAQAQVAATDREHAVLCQQQQQLRSQIDRARHQAEISETKYRHLVERQGKPLPDLLQAAQREEEKVRHGLETIRALEKCHRNFLQEAGDTHCCPICDRNMTDADLAKMQRFVKEKTEAVPAAVRKREESLRRAHELVTTVTGFLPQHAEVERLRRDELPKLEAQRSSAKDRGDAQGEVLRDLTAKLEALRFEERECRDLMSSAEKIREINRTLTATAARIAEEDQKLCAAHGADARALDLVVAELDSLQQQMAATAEEQQKLMKECDARRRVCDEAAQQLHGARQTCGEKQMLVEKRKAIRADYDAACTEFKKAQQDVTDMQAQLPPVEERLRRFEAERASLHESGDRREREMTARVETHQGDLSTITARVGEIRQYIAEKRAARLESAVAELARAERAHRERAEAVARSEEKVGETQRQSNTTDRIKHHIHQNLEFRRKRAAVEQKKKELLTVQEEIRVRTSGHAGCWESIDKLNEDRGKLEREIALHTGQLQATEGQLRERQVELKSNKYDKIDERYASCMIRLTTSQMADEDLGKYYAALDRALMQYHDQKISEINDIIKELWIKTYRGQDIDFIELRSDVDSLGGGRGRNYNYRVVMVKGGTVLDMRGRCSAGQKVLASLVVRIALSQAFCCDCGILALDEPTTNLDSENIYSLGQALQELIHTRRGHSNFQLIVITHDEGFVRQIGHACGTEHVYHVTKDGEGQYSRIAKRPMSDMM